MIEDRHPVIARLVLCGYPSDSLVDPANMSPERLSEGDWHYVRVTGELVERFAVDGDDVTEPRFDGHAGAVKYGRGAGQPIGFEDPLNEPLPDLGVHGAAAAFFAPLPDPDACPDLSTKEAVMALAMFGSEAWIPEEAAHTIIGAVGGALTGVSKPDPDTNGEIHRAPGLAVAVANALDVPIASSSANGHKKRRRETFYGTLENLKKATGAAPEA